MPYFLAAEAEMGWKKAKVLTEMNEPMSMGESIGMIGILKRLKTGCPSNMCRENHVLWDGFHAK